MPTAVAVLTSEKQELVATAPGEPWKRVGCCTTNQSMKVYLVDQSDPDNEKSVYRMEFGGGSVTVAHPYLAKVPDLTQDNTAWFRITPRAEIKVRFWGDQAKQEIWLHQDPGTNVFDEVLTLDNLSLSQDAAGRWVYLDANGEEVGRIPTPVVRAFSTERGTAYSTDGTIEVFPQEDGTHLLRVTVDQAWMTERFNAGDVVVIDPTTVTSSTQQTATAYSNQRKSARFSNGILFDMFYDGANLVCRYSTDNGTTWNTPTTGATIGAYPDSDVFIDEDDYIHLAVNSAGALGTGYIRGTPNAGRTGYTWSTRVDILPGTEYRYPSIVAHREGTGWKAHVFHSYVFSGGTANQVLYRSVTITSGGTITADGAGTIWASAGFGTNVHVYPSVSFDASKNLYVAWTANNTGTGKGIRFVKATYSEGAWTFGAEQALTEAQFAYNGELSSYLDSSGRLHVAFVQLITTRGVLYYLRRNADGTVTTPTAVADVSGLDFRTPSITGNDSKNEVYIFYGRFSGTFDQGIAYRKSADSGSSWGLSEVTVDTGPSVTGYYPSVRRGSAGNAIDAVYTLSGGSPYSVKHHRVALNSAPQAPIITSQSVFHAASGLTATVQHKDDPGDTMTGLYFKRTYGTTSEWWNGSAWVTSEPVSPLAASGTSANVTVSTGWVAGTTYQLYAATVDSGGLKGPYNSIGVTTKASVKPVFAYTSPGASVGTTKTRVQGTMTTAAGVTPRQYIVKEYAADGTTVLNGPTTIDSTGALDYEVQYNQTNSTSYQMGVIPIDSDGLQGDEVKRAFTTSFTSPLAAIPVIAATDTLALIRVSWTNPAGGQAVAYNDLMRREPNTATWTRIATNLPLSGSYPDYAVASGRVYEYKVVAVGTNNVTADSNVVSAGITLTNGMWLHNPLDPVGTAHLFQYRDVNLGDTQKLTSGEFRFAGRDGLAVQFDGKMKERALRLKVSFVEGSDDKAMLEAFLDSRSALCFRDFKGRLVYGVLRELPITDERWGGTVDLEFTRVSFNEGV